MADQMRCPTCGEETPSDARFCIGCGTTLDAATGPTLRLAGKPCRFCASENPENATYCLQCGHALNPTSAVPVTPRPRPAVTMARPAGRRASHQGGFDFGQPWMWMWIFFPLMIVFNRYATILIPIFFGVGFYAAMRSRNRRDNLLALVLIGGFSVLMITKTIWPGILVLGLIAWIVRKL